MTGDLLSLLAARAAAGRPLRVGLIGARRAAALFLAARRIAGLHLLGDDVLYEPNSAAVRIRRLMEKTFAQPTGARP